MTEIKVLDLILFKVISPIIEVIGTLGNLIMLVYIIKKRRALNKFILMHYTALGVLAIFITNLTMLRYIFAVFFHQDIRSRSQTLCWLHSWLTNSSVASANWIIATLSIARTMVIYDYKKDLLTRKRYGPNVIVATVIGFNFVVEAVLKSAGGAFFEDTCNVLNVDHCLPMLKIAVFMKLIINYLIPIIVYIIFSASVCVYKKRQMIQDVTLEMNSSEDDHNITKTTHTTGQRSPGSDSFIFPLSRNRPSLFHTNGVVRIVLPDEFNKVAAPNLEIPRSRRNFGRGPRDLEDIMSLSVATSSTYSLMHDGSNSLPSSIEEASSAIYSLIKIASESTHSPIHGASGSIPSSNQSPRGSQGSTVVMSDDESKDTLSANSGILSASYSLMLEIAKNLKNGEADQFTESDGNQLPRKISEKPDNKQSDITLHSLFGGSEETLSSSLSNKSPEEVFNDLDKYCNNRLNVMWYLSKDEVGLARAKTGDKEPLEIRLRQLLRELNKSSYSGSTSDSSGSSVANSTPPKDFTLVTPELISNPPGVQKRTPTKAPLTSLKDGESSQNDATNPGLKTRPKEKDDTKTVKKNGKFSKFKFIRTFPFLRKNQQSKDGVVSKRKPLKDKSANAVVSDDNQEDVNTQRSSVLYMHGSASRRSDTLTSKKVRFNENEQWILYDFKGGLTKPMIVVILFLFLNTPWASALIINTVSYCDEGDVSYDKEMFGVFKKVSVILKYTTYAFPFLLIEVLAEGLCACCRGPARCLKDYLWCFD